MWIDNTKVSMILSQLVYNEREANQTTSITVTVSTFSQTPHLHLVVQLKSLF